ncbi:NmrA family protein [Cordyceps javanica]|uniref:NmrA family protein n=1 Tax=Cordyceps javanica TaxID=43265 RepID=A0A545VD73_9HYPO|nr:NmrA family protein [Cordyceps javanica]
MDTSSSPPLVFVVGGTGAQGMPVIRGLVEDGAYAVRFLTRDATSRRSQELLKLPNVTAVEGTFASEQDLRQGLRGATYAFINIDGFNAGEKTETFWAMRSYELALEEGIEFFVYGNLDFVYKKSGYDPALRCGHYDGKGRVGEWILQQTRAPPPPGNKRRRMGAALFTTGPYMSMAVAAGTPMSPTVEDGVVTWRVPLGRGAVAHVDLDDCGHYVRWLLDHPARADGLDLEVAVDLVGYDELARAFTQVTGRPARYVDTDLADYWAGAGPLGRGTAAAGYNADPADAATMTMRDNFTGFWNMWRRSGGGGEGGEGGHVIRRDWALLDEIHPGRVRSALEWFQKEEDRSAALGLPDLWTRVNNLRPVLKVAEDVQGNPDSEASLRWFRV